MCSIISETVLAIPIKFALKIVRLKVYMANLPMLVSMPLTLMQGHSGSPKANNQRCILSATKQAIRLKHATTVGHFLHDLDFTNVYMA